MGAVVTKFEVRLPLDTGNGTAIDIAVENFLSGLRALTAYTFENDYQVDQSSNISQYNLTFGLLTNTQAASALSLLNTLNTALQNNGASPVVCYSYPVTLQP